MAHDVFISHSSNNRTIANAVCAALESAGVRCWIAPRDVMPGRTRTEWDLVRKSEGLRIVRSNWITYPDPTPSR